MTRRTLLQAAAVPSPRTRSVFFDHDGGMPDDYLSTILLLTMPHVEVLGIAVTPADCYIEPALSATRKILELMGRTAIPVAASAVRGMNPFPEPWRRTSYAMDKLLKRPPRTPLIRIDGVQLAIDSLRKSPRPVTMLATGPLSTLAAALERAPEIEAKIRELVWMGGALNVKGNVGDLGQDGSAEWNVYWDPPAAARVWRSRIPIVLCPLDITNRVPVTPAFIAKLHAQARSPLAKLTADAYGHPDNNDLYFWDILTTAYLGVPEIFTLRDHETEIVTEGSAAGRTRIQRGGRKIRALHTVDTARFHDYFLAQLRR